MSAVGPHARLAALARAAPGLSAEQLVAELTSLADDLAGTPRTAGRSSNDELTGLPGRAAFLRRLEEALARSRGVPGAFAVLLVDIDRFRLVNDRYGPASGDRVLLAVAARVRTHAPDDATVARLGGDVFAVLTEDSGGERAALRLAEALLQALSAPVELDYEALAVTASIGVSVADGTDEPVRLLADADAALRRAKRGHGGSFVAFDPSMRGRTTEHVAVEADLRRALGDGQLRLEYQPIVSLTDARVVGLEALLRWDHPVRGTLHPRRFLDIADETGLLVPIGRWALREVTDRLAEWGDGQLAQAPYVAINLTSRQVADPALAGEIELQLGRARIPPRQLQLEVGEDVLMQEAESPRAVLQELREVGVRIMLDDFGRGASSLGLLRRLPVDGLKIDGSLVKALHDDARERHIVGAIVAMARALGLEVVGKSVESAQHGHHLRGLGCALGQGYALAPPARPEAVPGILRAGLSAESTAFGAVDDGEPATGSFAEARADGETLTLGEAAEALGVSASTARRWADTGRLRVARTTGGHRRFARADVERAARAGRPGDAAA